MIDATIDAIFGLDENNKKILTKLQIECINDKPERHIFLIMTDELIKTIAYDFYQQLKQVFPNNSEADIDEVMNGIMFILKNELDGPIARKSLGLN